MSEYAMLKAEFIRNLMESGTNSYEKTALFVTKRAPEELLKRWQERFYKAERPRELSRQRRLINHFSLGADPEFSFISEGAQLHANQLGLKAGLCFGADNNGRLVELRPHPSRFALDVLASMLQELRFLAAYHPETIKTQWKAGAFDGNDALGGHVHFGRKWKREGAVAEHHVAMKMDALDRVTALLQAAGLFSPEEMFNRRAARGGRYGRWSDIRYQRHGFEYRTFPSWLYTPWVAYLSLVVAKLALATDYFEKYFPPLSHLYADNNMLLMKISEQDARKHIRNLLAAYKGLDDDARIAYLALDVWGLPGYNSYNKDFKSAWGIAPIGAKMLLPELLPTTIKPGFEDSVELYMHLVFSQPLNNLLPKPNWPFQKVPKGFVPLQHLMRTDLAPGIGEFSWDLLYPQAVAKKFNITSDHDGRYLVLSENLCAFIGPERVRHLRNAMPVATERTEVQGIHSVRIAESFLKGARAAETKRLLTTHLPLVRLCDVDSFNLESWSQPKASKTPRPPSVVLYPVPKLPKEAL